jgi:hypothetical protein
MALMLRAGAMKRAISILAASALLAGCAQQAWYKPGAGTADFQVDKANCISQAYAQVPYAPGIAQLPTYSSCQGTVFYTSCTPVGGGAVAYDANTNMRGEVFSGCMYGKGWALMTRKQAEEMSGTPQAPQPAPLSPTAQHESLLDAEKAACAQGLADACRTVQGLEKNRGQ